MQEIREESEEVLYATADIATVSRRHIDALKVRAQRTRRKRCRLCTHPDAADPLHGMLIVHGREAYVRPHRHFGKSESLHVIEGSAMMMVFDEEGRMTKAVALGEFESGERFYYRIPEGVFHSLLITSDWFVFHESTTGPFDRTKTENATWAPEDGDDDAVREYLARLLDEAERLTADDEK